MNKKDFIKEIDDIKNMISSMDKGEYAIYRVIGWVSSGKKTYTSSQLKQVFDLVIPKSN